MYHVSSTIKAAKKVISPLMAEFFALYLDINKLRFSHKNKLRFSHINKLRFFPDFGGSKVIYYQDLLFLGANYLPRFARARITHKVEFIGSH